MGGGRGEVGAWVCGACWPDCWGLRLSCPTHPLAPRLELYRACVTTHTATRDPAYHPTPLRSTPVGEPQGPAWTPPACPPSTTSHQSPITTNLTPGSVLVLVAGRQQYALGQASHESERYATVCHLSWRAALPFSRKPYRDDQETARWQGNADCTPELFVCSCLPVPLVPRLVAKCLT